jgi:tetratricopeptide (TPR) repeat protein
MELLEVAVKEN